ncbi:MAG: hypothetical protein EPO21_05610 [Chloroflexota bacterium]|nr:MAG: hypothetical protein EPO21_05610 [Chloroflexota bacterium]
MNDHLGPGKPYGVIVCHATECAGALEAMDKLGGYYKLSKVDGWVTVNASELEVGKEQCRKLGAVLAGSSPGSAA